MQNKVKKERLDVLLTELGYFESRERAKRAIMEGIVFVNDEREDKAGTTFPVDARIEVRGSKLKYVSRGGLKLEKAIVNYGLDLTGKICMDIGSSTGGFTDCMLQNGAVKVYAIDSGTNQLAYKLRVDDRVISMENTNFRYVTPEQIPDEIDFASVDVSFISLTKILPAALPLLSESAEMVCLIKPQFEAGREKVGKKGVVRDPKVHEEVLVNVMTFAASCKFRFKAVTFSPIKGPEGNIEYILYMAKSDSKMSEEEHSSWLNKVPELVKEAHGELDK